MPDYKTMYYTLFNQISKTIEDLQNIQQTVEEMFINDDKSDFIIFNKEISETETQLSKP